MQKNNLTKEIQNEIIKYHLKRFCKQNAKSLGIIFKALIKGERAFGNKIHKQKSKKDKEMIKISKKEIPKDEQIKQDNENHISPLNALNIES